MPDTEKDEELVSELLTFRATRSLADAVDRLAYSDRRTRSFVLRDLVARAVDQLDDEELLELDS